MKALIIGFLALIGFGASALAGSPVGAERIVKEQRIAQLEWQQMQLNASTPEAMAEVVSQQPDFSKFGDLMVSEIDGSLQKSWTMPYIIWVLREHPTLSAKGVTQLMGRVEEYHRQSPLIGDFCVALVGAGNQDPQKAVAARLTQEKTRVISGVMNGSGSRQVKGLAALALSGILAQRGDDPEVNKKRLDLIRMAIIDAAEVKVGVTTVAEIAREEIYRMSNLSKGAKAPELAGADSAGESFQLSDSLGKVVILIFWSSWEQGEQVIEFSKKMEKTYAGKMVGVVGVNRDTTENLRKLVAADKSVGKSFSDPSGELFKIYRVMESPVCYVLDQQGLIQYNGGLGSFVDFTVSALLDPVEK